MDAPERPADDPGVLPSDPPPLAGGGALPPAGVDRLAADEEGRGGDEPAGASGHLPPATAGPLAPSAGDDRPTPQAAAAGELADRPPAVAEGPEPFSLASSDAPPADADAPSETASASGRRSEQVDALAGWVRVVGGAILFALALRVLAFEAYRIPSTSMEDTLLVGDFVLVSKLHYGARVLGRRLPGLDGVDRGDVAVFNYPPDLDPNPARRTPYIKRVVGLPGDTLAVVAKQVRVGSAALAPPSQGRQSWLAAGVLPSAEALDSLGLGGRVQRVAAGRWAVSATRAQADGLRAEPGIDAVDPLLRPMGDGSASFPAARRYSLDDYGPVVVPQKGAAVVLDDLSWPVVRGIVERFEGHATERTADGFLIDGRPATSYTFAQDYYFVLGDSRDDSADSRIWGFVPFDHVVGKAVAVYFSWDAEAGAVRWGRVGRGIRD